MINADEFLAAFHRREFFLEYLPIISLTDGRCIGAEALTRWKRPNGVVSPLDFIPLMENTPFSGLLTYWVVETVAVEVGGWLGEHPDTHISINVPPEIVGRGGLMYAGEKSGLNALAPQIVLELTERGLPDSIAVAAMNRAHEMGIRVALDDVTLVNGANLAILARCKFDIIKLDRSLIAQISPQNPTPDWLQSISALLGSSGLVVTAEGVETEQQLVALREAGVQAVQGFYLSRPIPAAAFIAYHREAGVSGSLIDRAGSVYFQKVAHFSSRRIRSSLAILRTAIHAIARLGRFLVLKYPKETLKKAFRGFLQHGFRKRGFRKPSFSRGWTPENAAVSCPARETRLNQRFPKLHSHCEWSDVGTS